MVLPFSELPVTEMPRSDSENLSAVHAVKQPAGRIRVAVIGAGDFGRNHARVYREIEGAELIGGVRHRPRAGPARSPRNMRRKLCRSWTSSRAVWTR